MDNVRHCVQTPTTQDPGTLIWVGDRTSAETAGAYRYCEDHVSQIAYRRDLADVLRRPADRVQHILVTRSHRQQPLEELLGQVATAYPDAQLIEMMGSLCEGQRHLGALPNLNCQRFYWHQWNQHLPSMLRAGESNSRDDRQLVHQSVAIVASNFADADPLMDVATSAGATSVWFRCPETIGARNFGVVWWDDSVAAPTSGLTWRNRLAAMDRRACQRPKHVWLVSAPRIHQVQVAKTAGVNVVVSKPHRLDALVSTIAQCGTDLIANEDERRFFQPPHPSAAEANATVPARAAA